MILTQWMSNLHVKAHMMPPERKYALALISLVLLSTWTAESWAVKDPPAVDEEHWRFETPPPAASAPVCVTPERPRSNGLDWSQILQDARRGIPRAQTFVTRALVGTPPPETLFAYFDQNSIPVRALHGFIQQLNSLDLTVRPNWGRLTIVLSPQLWGSTPPRTFEQLMRLSMTEHPRLTNAMLYAYATNALTQLNSWPNIEGVVRWYLSANFDLVRRSFIDRILHDRNLLGWADPRWRLAEWLHPFFLDTRTPFPQERLEHAREFYFHIIQNLHRQGGRHATAVFHWCLHRGYAYSTRTHPSHLYENPQLADLWNHNRPTDSSVNILRLIDLFGGGTRWPLSFAEAIRSAIRLNWEAPTTATPQDIVGRIAMSIPLSVATLEELRGYWHHQEERFSYFYHEGRALSERLSNLNHFEPYYAFSEIYHQLATRLDSLIFADRRQQQTQTRLPNSALPTPPRTPNTLPTMITPEISGGSLNTGTDPYNRHNQAPAQDPRPQQNRPPIGAFLHPS